MCVGEGRGGGACVGVFISPNIPKLVFSFLKLKIKILKLTSTTIPQLIKLLPPTLTHKTRTSKKHTLQRKKESKKNNHSLNLTEPTTSRTKNEPHEPSQTHELTSELRAARSSPFLLQTIGGVGVPVTSHLISRLSPTRADTWFTSSALSNDTTDTPVGGERQVKGSERRKERGR